MPQNVYTHAGFCSNDFNKMQPKVEKLLRKVIYKSIGKNRVVASFLNAIEHVLRHGDSSDIALVAMTLDLIEQNVSVMQDYLNDDSAIEIYEDIPVGSVLQAVMAVFEMNTLLMTGQIKELAEKKAYLDSVITMLQARVK